MPRYTHWVPKVAIMGITPRISMDKPFMMPVSTPMHRHSTMHSHMGQPATSKDTTMIPDRAMDAPADRSLPPQTRQKVSPQPKMA